MARLGSYESAFSAKRANRLESALVAAAAAIRQGYKTREDRKADCPYDTPESYLKRSIYAVFHRNMNFEAKNDLRSIMARRKLPARRMRSAAREFYWAMLIMFGDEEYDTQTMLPPAKRSRFARQMCYAFKHDVPAHLLIGFLYQCGSPSLLSKKLASNAKERWLRPGKREQAVVEIFERLNSLELKIEPEDVSAHEAAKAARW